MQNIICFLYEMKLHNFFGKKYDYRYYYWFNNTRHYILPLFKELLLKVKFNHLTYKLFIYLFLLSYPRPFVVTSIKANQVTTSGIESYFKKLGKVRVLSSSSFLIFGTRLKAPSVYTWSPKIKPHLPQDRHPV